MTDYEKDYNAWKNDHSVYGDFIPAPKRSNYDEYGFNPKLVVYDEYNGKKLILDKYLVDVHGIDYARQYPRMVVKKKKDIEKKMKTRCEYCDPENGKEVKPILDTDYMTICVIGFTPIGNRRKSGCLQIWDKQSNEMTYAEVKRCPVCGQLLYAED